MYRDVQQRTARRKEATQVQMQSKCISQTTVFQKFPDIISLYRRSFATLSFLHCAKRPTTPSYPPKSPPSPHWYPGLHCTRWKDFSTLSRIGELDVFKRNRENILPSLPPSPGRSISGFVFSSGRTGYPDETITTLLPPGRIMNADFTEYHLSPATDSLKSVESAGGIFSRFDT